MAEHDEADLDGKDTWPDPKVTAPAGHAARSWPAHVTAFEPRGRGRDPRPTVTIVSHRKEDRP